MFDIKSTSLCNLLSTALRRALEGGMKTEKLAYKFNRVCIRRIVCDVYVGGKVRVSEFMIFLTLQHQGSK